MSEKTILCPKCQTEHVRPFRTGFLCDECGALFPPPEKARCLGSEPLDLFISYGHPESEIVEEICDVLVANGHSLWFDVYSIRTGNDWRDKIADGVLRSNGVLACLSRHAVRAPEGVCLSELAIAVGVRGGNIRTVLLEPEDVVRAPSTLTHRQWLDMSDWREKKAAGGEVFRPWFDEKMRRLLQVIESQENQDFVGQITEIRKKLLVGYDTGKQRDLLNRCFVGREWLTEQVQQWLTDPDGEQVCVVYGDPGVGKSAFAANYTHYNESAAASLFCEYRKPTFSDPRVVIQTLAYLLACRLPAYRRSLLALLEFPLAAKSEAELFDYLLGDTLQMHGHGGHETLCVVVDGLDEAGDIRNNPLAETLAKYASHLPTWLRVLVTARRVSAVTAALGSAVRRIEIVSDSQDNLADIRRYFEETLGSQFGSDPAWGTALEELTRRSGGIFLYAQVVADGILKGKLPLTDTASFPENLNAAFFAWFGWFFPDETEYQERYQDAVSAILCAPAPLPEEELEAVFGWNRNGVRSFVRRMEVFFRRGENVFGKKTVQFSHPYLEQWLDSEAAGRFQADRQAGVECLADGFYVLFEEDAESLTEYEALYLQQLLEGCRRKRRKQLDAVQESETLFEKIMHAGMFCQKWGHLDEALVCFRQGERLADGNDTPDGKLRLAVSLSGVGNVLFEQGEIAEAKSVYLRNLETSEQVVRVYGMSDEPEFLGTTFHNLGKILMEEGNLSEAKKKILRAKEICEQAVRENNTPVNLDILTGVCYTLVSILIAEGDLAGAKAENLRIIEICERSVRENRTPENFRRMIINLDHLTDLLRSEGDLAGAKEICLRMKDLAEQLVRKEGLPNDRNILSLCYNTLGLILQEEGNLEGSKNAYLRGLEIIGQLVSEQNIPRDRKTLRALYLNIGTLLKNEGNLEVAMDVFLRCREISEQLVYECDTPENLRVLAACCNYIGDLLYSKGDLEGAADAFLHCREVSEQLVRKRGTPDDLYFLAVNGCFDLGRVLHNKGDLKGAKDVYLSCLVVLEQLVYKRGTPDDRYFQAICYETLGEVKQEECDISDAKKLFSVSAKILEMLIGDPDAQQDKQGIYDETSMLACVYYSIAEISWRQKKFSDSLREIKRAEALAKQLVSSRGTESDKSLLCSIQEIKKTFSQKS